MSDNSGSSLDPGSGAGEGQSPPPYGQGSPPPYGQGSPPPYGQGSPPPYGQGSPAPYGQGPPPAPATPSSYPGPPATAYPGQQAPAGAYPGQQTRPYAGAPAPTYSGQQPPPYGSTDPSYLGPPGYPTGAYGVPPPPGYNTGWSRWAIAAFVTSFVPIIGILAAVPLAIVALVKIAKTSQKGRWMAIAAIIISLLTSPGIIAAALWWNGQGVERNDAGDITKEGHITFGAIQVGDCVSIPDPGGSGDVNTFELRGLPCSADHNAEAAAVFPIASDSFPGADSLDSQTVSQCQVQAQRYLNGGSPTGLQPYRLIPTESIWDDDNGHRVICFITRIDYSDLTGSLAK